MAEQKNKTYKAIASFDSGLGNTLNITFPKVLHEGVYMNTGVAFMPFMKEGYHFIKEGAEKPNKTLGLNDVETDFVKYLYKIREVNRTEGTLHYHWFSGPRGGAIRERVFLAGKIFPVMSIWYSGENIECTTAKITTKTTSIGELRTRFGETFNEYKKFSINYLSIDNDNIKIYVPQNSMGINYVNVLKDFLTNSDNTKVAASHGEFPDMETYTLATDNTQLQKGCWLIKDREANNTIWQDGCMYIVEHKLQGVLAPFSQIADFYTLLDNKITHETQHKTRWLKGAKKLVNSLKMFESIAAIGVDNDVETILNELNIGICDYAITEFYELFYGKYKNNPLNTLQKAYEFDLQFVKHEQGVVAVPIYSKTSEHTIRKYQDMADQDAKGIHGLGGWGIDNILRKKVIPQFDEPWQGEVTDAQFRIDLPMLMLWLDRHKPTSENFKGKIDKNGYLLEKFKKIIRKYETN